MNLYLRALALWALLALFGASVYADNPPQGQGVRPSSSPSDGQTIVWNATTKQWDPSTPSAGGGETLAQTLALGGSTNGSNITLTTTDQIGNSVATNSAIRWNSATSSLEINPGIIASTPQNVRVTFSTATNQSPSFNIISGSLAVGKGSDLTVLTPRTIIATGTFSDGGTNSSTTPEFLYLNPTINYTGATRTGSYTGIKLDVVETSLPTGTNYLLRMRAGASGTTDIFGVTNLGAVVLGGSQGVFLGPSGSASAPTYSFSANTNRGMLNNTVDGGLDFAVAAGVKMTLLSDRLKLLDPTILQAQGGIAFGSGALNYQRITGPATTVTESRPPLDLSQSWNSGGTTFRGIEFNVSTDTASAADSTLLRLRVGGVDKFSVTKSGGVTVGGAFVPNCKTITSSDSPYTVAVDDYTILVNGAGGAITVNLPAVSSNRKRQLIIKATSVAGGNVTIARAGSDTIDGATSKTISTQYQSFTLQAPDGSSVDWAIE
jgi:hypothetical protein